MPTTKPRVTITLEPGMHELLRDLSRMNGESVSHIVSDMLETLAPTLERVVEAGRHFEQLSDDMKDRIRRNFADAEQRISPELEAMQADFLGLIESVSDARQQRDDPRAVTRGSRPPSSPTTPPRRDEQS